MQKPDDIYPVRWYLPTFELFCPFSKIDKNQWLLSRFHANLVTNNWSLWDPDPKLINLDPLHLGPL